VLAPGALDRGVLICEGGSHGGRQEGQRTRSRWLVVESPSPAWICRCRYVDAQVERSRSSFRHAMPPMQDAIPPIPLGGGLGSACAINIRVLQKQRSNRSAGQRPLGAPSRMPRRYRLFFFSCIRLCRALKPLPSSSVQPHTDAVGAGVIATGAGEPRGRAGTNLAAGADRRSAGDSDQSRPQQVGAVLRHGDNASSTADAVR